MCAFRNQYAQEKTIPKGFGGQKETRIKEIVASRIIHYENLLPHIGAFAREGRRSLRMSNASQSGAGSMVPICVFITPRSKHGIWPTGYTYEIMTPLVLEKFS